MERSRFSEGQRVRPAVKREMAAQVMCSWRDGRRESELLLAAFGGAVIAEAGVAFVERGFDVLAHLRHVIARGLLMEA